jgi:hypothetical protein
VPRSPLVAALDLRLARVRICNLCLLEISWALRGGDAGELRRALRFFVPLLWDEGLEETVRPAVERAHASGVPGADVAARDLARRGEDAWITESVVLDLAEQQIAEMERWRLASLN